jgi:hypothetical protein
MAYVNTAYSIEVKFQRYMVFFVTDSNDKLLDEFFNEYLKANSPG